jgi:hypothetical protein
VPWAVEKTNSTTRLRLTPVKLNSNTMMMIAIRNSWFRIPADLLAGLTRRLSFRQEQQHLHNPSMRRSPCPKHSRPQ